MRAKEGEGEGEGEDKGDGEGRRRKGQLGRGTSGWEGRLVKEEKAEVGREDRERLSEEEEEEEIQKYKKKEQVYARIRNKDRGRRGRVVYRGGIKEVGGGRAAGWAGDVRPRCA